MHEIIRMLISSRNYLDLGSLSFAILLRSKSGVINFINLLFIAWMKSIVGKSTFERRKTDKYQRVKLNMRIMTVLKDFRFPIISTISNFTRELNRKFNIWLLEDSTGNMITDISITYSMFMKSNWRLMWHFLSSDLILSA